MLEPNPDSAQICKDYGSFTVWSHLKSAEATDRERILQNSSSPGFPKFKTSQIEQLFLPLSLCVAETDAPSLISCSILRPNRLLLRCLRGFQLSLRLGFDLNTGQKATKTPNIPKPTRFVPRMNAVVIGRITCCIWIGWQRVSDSTFLTSSRAEPHLNLLDTCM